ncbi:MAG: D-aminoacyl-tRNA deacylase [Candidatus Anoxychlamydiales bacterium]|nr:D-aminoacyl-tRNA deacylase [Candidatus Anoxychlamydiales bacterium]
MRALIQRVEEASVEVDDKIVSQIDSGLLIFIGFHKDDKKSNIDYLINKIINLRIFSDDNDKMNLSIKDNSKSVLIVSQFTLYGDVKKGRRPSFIDSLDPKLANEFYIEFVNSMKKEIKNVQTGIFQAKMKVHLINDGPVTFIIDSKD